MEKIKYRYCEGLDIPMHSAYGRTGFWLVFHDEYYKVFVRESMAFELVEVEGEVVKELPHNEVYMEVVP